jgi:hypothetical protein
VSFVSANGTAIEVFKATNAGNISVSLANQNTAITIQGSSGNATDLKFYPQRSTVNAVGAEICVPIKADNFTALAGMQGSIRFDSTKVTFVRVQNVHPQLVTDGLTAADILNSPAGTLKYLWVHNFGRSTTNGATMFDVCVNANALTAGDSAFIRYVNDPVRILAFDEATTNIPVVTTPGYIVMPLVSVLPISVTGALTPVKCNGGADGAIALTVSGGTGTFTYAWTGANNFTSTNRDITGLRAGRYIVATTSGNVTKNDTFNIVEPTQLAATQAVTNINCAGMATGAITMTVTGGTTPYTYLWSNSATTRDINNLAAGPYSVVITDANQCRLTPATPLVTEPTVLNVEVAAATNITCNGANNGEIRLNVTGGTAPFTMRWAGPNGFSSTTQNLVNLAAGNYTVTGTDSRQCAKTSQPIVITEPAVLALGTPSTTGSNCGQAMAQHRLRRQVARLLILIRGRAQMVLPQPQPV